MEHRWLANFWSHAFYSLYHAHFLRLLVPSSTICYGSFSISTPFSVIITFTKLLRDIYAVCPHRALGFLPRCFILNLRKLLPFQNAMLYPTLYSALDVPPSASITCIGLFPSSLCKPSTSPVG